MKRLSCQEVLDQLWEYLDDDSRAELRQAVDEHLTGCKHCQVEVDSLKSTIRLYRSEDDVATPVPISNRLMDLLKAAYRENDRDPQH